ncbi:MAG: hypothetical protein AB7O26_04690, partial [Planctomycetaceae bacterium]
NCKERCDSGLDETWHPGINRLQAEVRAENAASVCRVMVCGSGIEIVSTSAQNLYFGVVTFDREQHPE